MKKQLLVLGILPLMMSLTGCKNESTPTDGDKNVVSLSKLEYSITVDDLYQTLKDRYGTNYIIQEIDNKILNNEYKTDDEAKEYAKAQVEQMKQQYAAYGYEWEDALAQAGYSSEDKLIEDYAKDYKKQLTAKKYIKKDISEDEINEYYEKEIYGNYTVKHILIKPDTKSDATDEEKEEAKTKAKEKAEEVIKKLDDGAAWADLVKEYSDDTGSKEDEGLIKDFTKGDVVDEFFTASVELKKGKYTKEPVESTYGYHVILKVSNTKKPSLKDSKEKILDAISQNKLNNDENLYKNTWIEIRKDYKLEISDSTVNNNYNKVK